MLAIGEYGYTHPVYHPVSAELNIRPGCENYLDCSALSQTNRVIDVRMYSTLLRVDLDQAELCPDPFDEVVEAENGGVSQVTAAKYGKRSLQAKFTTDDYRVIFSGQPVHLFHTDRIYLVVYVWEKG